MPLADDGLGEGQRKVGWLVW